MIKLNKSKERGSIPVAILVVVIAVLLFILISSLAGFKDKLFSLLYPKPPSYASNDCKQLYVQVSADKKNWSDNITLPNGATKYYIKALDYSDSTHNIVCNTDFAVGTSSTPWGPYHSGDDGIARIDLIVNGTMLKNGTYSNATFRPCKNSVNTTTGVVTCTNTATTLLSNPITVVLNNSSNNIADNDVSSYYIDTPGYVWTFTNSFDQSLRGDKNDHQYDPAFSGTTRLQIEEEENICPQTTTSTSNGDGSIRVRPGRFTKDNINAYVDGGVAYNLRWLMASPDFKYNNGPAVSWNNFRWVYGHFFYNSATPGINNLQDILPSSAYDGTLEMNQTGLLPGYAVFPRNIFGNSYINPNSGFAFLGTHDTDSNGIRKITCWNPPVGNTTPPAGYFAPSTYNQWETRLDIEQDSVSTSAYSGPVSRIDYYEGVPNPIIQSATSYANGSPTGNNGFFRETWYLAKGIGVVEIKGKQFNNYANKGASNCIDDPDCLNDAFLHPDGDTKLTSYFQNPILSTSVAVDNSNCTVKPPDSAFSSTISTTTTAGYWLKASPAYTGYLETGPNNPKKWAGVNGVGLWLNNGYVCVGAAALNGLANGAYSAAFRIWIPNDVFPGETRVGTNNILWSDQISDRITVNLVSTLPSPSPVVVGSTAKIINGLVGYWNMDEKSWTNNCSTASVLDTSGKGNNAKSCPASTGPLGGVAGKIGNGGLFDGIDDYVTITNTNNVVLPAKNGPFTISLWFKANLLDVSNVDMLIANETYLSSGFRYGIDTGQYSGGIKVFFWASESGGTVALKSTTIPVKGNWYHPVVTYDGTTARLYMNGIQESTSVGTIISNTNAINLGKLSGKKYWNGYIDDIKIYNRALSATEVTQL